MRIGIEGYKISIAKQVEYHYGNITRTLKKLKFKKTEQGLITAAKSKETRNNVLT